MTNHTQKTWIVWGGAGYLGNEVCWALLRRGYKVRCYDNFHKGQADHLFNLIGHPDFEFKELNITRKEHCDESVIGADYVLNFAGIVGFPSCRRSPILSEAVNVGGAANLVESLNKYNDNIPLYYSATGSSYGKIDGVCTEESPLNPLTEYGIHKMIGEQETLKYKSGLVYRLATIMGVSGQNRINLLVNNLVYDAHHNRYISVAEPDCKRTFLDIRDETRGVIMGMENFDRINYRLYNLGDNRLNYSKRDIAEKIREKTKCAVFYDDFMTDCDKRDYSCNYSRIKTDLGFEAKYTLDDTIDSLLKAVPLIQIKHQYA